MASPPAGSPPSSGLVLPRQRPPTLALPSKSRRSSFAPSTGSAHPLRQTSFPPTDSSLTLEEQHQQAEDAALNAFSPGEDGSLDDFSDSEIQSAISGPAGGTDEAFSKKRKRGEKRPKGRPPKSGTLRAGSASVVNGDDGRSTKRGTTAGAVSVVTAGEGDEEDDDDEEDAAATATNAGIIDAAELEKENQNRYLFREAVNAMHQTRYDSFNKVKLRKEDVRRLVNQTLSQSVPPNVITVVQAYTKMFAGMLIEGAREVQAEWMAANPTLPDGQSSNRAYKRMRLMQPEEEDEESEAQVEQIKEATAEDSTKQEDESDEARPLKKESDDGDDTTLGSILQVPDSQSKVIPKAQPNGKPESQLEGREGGDFDDLEHIQPGAWSLAKYVDEADRGPLLPDHLREALRRYKKSRAGGTVGFTGISLARPEVTAPRVGGQRLFK